MSTAKDEVRLAFLARRKAFASLDVAFASLDVVGPLSPLQAPCRKSIEVGCEAKHHCRNISCEK